MKVRITKLNGRENLQTNLRNTTKRERSCNLVEKQKSAKHQLVKVLNPKHYKFQSENPVDGRNK